MFGHCIIPFPLKVVSDLKINFDNSKIVKIGRNGDANLLTRVLRCKAIKFPVKYLGIPLGAKYKNIASWEPILNYLKRDSLGGSVTSF